MVRTRLQGPRPVGARPRSRSPQKKDPRPKAMPRPRPRVVRTSLRAPRPEGARRPSRSPQKTDRRPKAMPRPRPHRAPRMASPAPPPPRLPQRPADAAEGVVVAAGPGSRPPVRKARKAPTRKRPKGKLQRNERDSRPQRSLAPPALLAPEPAAASRPRRRRRQRRSPPAEHRVLLGPLPERALVAVAGAKRCRPSVAFKTR